MTKYLSVSSIAVLLFSLILLGAASSCKKSSKAPAQSSPMIQDTITVQSIIGTTTGDLDPSRLGFIDLYDGVAFDQASAQSNSSKIDFAYNYHGGGCPTCRFFENVAAMSTRTGYVEEFSTLTRSVLENVEYYDSVSVSDFEGIKSGSDIDDLFTKKGLATKVGSSAEITNMTTDVAVGSVFAFIDKNGKQGFFKISDYVANVPTGNAAQLTLYVKVDK